MRAYDEKDYDAIGRVQEMRNCTRDNARKQYKKAVLHLADPDIANRAAIVISNFQLGSKPEAERETKPKSHSTGRDKKAVTVTMPDPGAPETQVADSYVQGPVTHIVPLTPVPDEKYLFTATLRDKRVVLIKAEINHSQEKSRYGFVGVSNNRLEKAKAYARSNSLSVAIAIIVRVAGVVDQGYLIPVGTFQEWKLESKNAATLSADARTAYALSGWGNCKFEEITNATNAA